jgi:FK506-binding nuclear protein
VKPGEQFTFVAPADLKITNIALGEKLEDENGRTTVKLKHESITRKPEDELKTTVVICSLIGGKVRAMRVVR